MDWRDRIEATPDTLGGKPRIRGTRLGVAFLLDLLAAGWTVDEVLENYPHLTSADLQALFAFAADVSADVHLLSVDRKAA